MGESVGAAELVIVTFLAWLIVVDRLGGLTSKAKSPLASGAGGLRFNPADVFGFF